MKWFLGRIMEFFKSLGFNRDDYAASFEKARRFFPEELDELISQNAMVASVTFDFRPNDSRLAIVPDNDMVLYQIWGWRSSIEESLSAATGDDWSCWIEDDCIFFKKRISDNVRA